VDLVGGLASDQDFDAAVVANDHDGLPGSDFRGHRVDSCCALMSDSRITRVFEARLVPESRRATQLVEATAAVVEADASYVELPAGERELLGSKWMVVGPFLLEALERCFRHDLHLLSSQERWVIVRHRSPV
jgi:hypothetical protein